MGRLREPRIHELTDIVRARDASAGRNVIHKPSAGSTPELKWLKSSYSDSSSGNDCVEVATAPGTVHVRDSKNVTGPRLTVTSAAWADFVSHAFTN
ncbi:DUF397 domain-containing protein [Streptomyces sp. NPDC055663]